MRILVTGAGGMLGSDVVRAAAAGGHEPLAYDRATLDITDAAAVDRIVTADRPNTVINCAAWTDVDGAEAAEGQATAVNGEAAGNLARATAGAGAALVHVSTDYVFDGRAGAPYVESDQANPQSAYGRSKLAGETAVAAGHPKPAIVRSSWLFGLGGRNFVDTMLRLATERGEVSVVDDQVGCPTFTEHLAEALVVVAERGTTGTLHVAGAGHCSWYEFAAEIFRASATQCELHRASTADLARPAPRPAFSALASERPDAPRLADWREGLGSYLARLHALRAAPGAAA